jgi:hypothetical protein
MFSLYTAWQGLRVQQAANLAARIQGQERVSGGTSVQAIDQQNGDEVGTGDTLNTNSGNSSAQSQPGGNINRPDPSSVYGKYYFLVKSQFFPKTQDQVFIPKPIIGQNVDRVSVTRVIHIPTIPFLSQNGLPKTMVLQGAAWGGEDTSMYGLPRWLVEWMRLMTDSANSSDHD